MNESDVTPRSGSALNSRLDDELRSALGRLPKPSAPKSFIEDLTAAFSVRYVDGHDEWMWNPRLNVGVGSFGGTTPIAQRVVSQRAQAVLAEVLPLLEQLKPLDSKADPEDVEALREQAQTALKALVSELGREGVIREDRVRSLFTTLDLAVPPGEQLPSGRALLRLGQIFALLNKKLEPNRELVQTLNEEQNLQNFIIIQERVTSLAITWLKFIEQRDSSFSTQLFELSRGLALVEQSVDDVVRACDKSDFGATKRDAEIIEPPKAEEGKPSKFTAISLEGFLTWTKEFAAQEAPRIIDQSGRYGAKAVAETLDRLSLIADTAGTKPGATADDPREVGAIENERFTRRRVVRIWDELKSSLKDAAKAAKDAAK